METKRSFLILMLLSSMAVCCFSQYIGRWTMGSGGGIGYEELGFYGYSVGQATKGHITTAESDTAVVGYWRKNWVPVICISVTPDSWVVRDDAHPDTIPCNYTISMMEEDVITVSNCGNCAVDLGLVFSGAVPDILTLSYIPEVNRAVVRANIRRDYLMPLMYDTMRDFVKDVTSWASDVVFGPSGDNLATNETMRLWFQMVTPIFVTGGSGFVHDHQITIQLKAKYNLP